MRLVLDNAIDYAIVTLDLEYRITLFNRGAELLFGYAPAEVAGRRPREVRSL